MKKFPIIVTWQMSKVVFVEAHSEAGALDKALNEQPDNGEVVPESMNVNILVVK